MKNSSASIFLASILFIISFSFAFSAQKPTCYPKDLQSLKQIYASFHKDIPSGDCCNWDSVTCDTHHPFPVTQLLFIDNPNITGQISPAIGDLSSVYMIRIISIPNLTGNIPPAITKLSQLNTLVISSTGLSGQIPTFLVKLKKLVQLDLTLNALTGSIPPELSQCPQLIILDLGYNKLTGTIPESFGQSKLNNLVVDSNFLTGTIPKSLGNLDFQVISFTNNKFIGDPSFLFGKNDTTLIFLEGNSFEFNLTNVKFSKSLMHLNLKKNKIFGSIPKEWTELDLTELDLSYNRLCGKIPQGGNLQTFETDSYAHNECLCGAPLPTCK